MNTELLAYGLLTGLSVVGIVNNSLKFNPVRFQCNNYILNTYLYFILAWSIVLSSIKLLEKYKISPKDLFAGSYSIIFAVLTIIILIGVLYIPPKRFFTKHFLYLIFIAAIGVTLYPLYIKNEILFKHVGITTLSILILLSIISFAYPSFINLETWGPVLFFILIGLLITRLVELLLHKRYPDTFDRSFNKKISYITIILFLFYILYDTKLLSVNAKLCKNDNADYINESLNIFIDSLNLFSNLFNVMDN